MVKRQNVRGKLKRSSEKGIWKLTNQHEQALGSESIVKACFQYCESSTNCLEICEKVWTLLRNNYEDASKPFLV
jgi:hypothetical protein